MSAGALRLCRSVLLRSLPLFPSRRPSLLYKWTPQQRTFRSICSAAAVEEKLPAINLLENLPKGDHWYNVPGWVAFTDLHVCAENMEVCMKGLRMAIAEAEKRGYGLLFLGDFWEKRLQLQVKDLCRVIPEIQRISMPTLMIPGNHDQVDRAGRTHSLSVLAAANSNIHVFDQPSMFLNALFLPYRERHSELKAAVDAANALSSGGHTFHTVFCHADIQGAKYNRKIQSRSGIDPSLLPPVKTYSGHYHIHHIVPNTETRYIGSLFQTDRGEHDQEKVMLVLDKSFELIERIRVDIGKRYFDIGSDLSKLEQLELRKGDEVTFMRPPEMTKAEAVAVEEGLVARELDVRRLEPPSEKKAARIDGAETLSPPELFQKYVEEDHLDADDPKREGMSWDELKQKAVETGQKILEGLKDQWPQSEMSVRLVIETVQMEGYGCFRDKVKYAIGSKGMRVITGRNEQDEGSQSNGSGKSTLAMATLWCLTGSDGRDPDMGRPTKADIVHDRGNCRTASVVVTGTSNGRRFTVKRTASKTKSGKLGKSTLEFQIERDPEKDGDMQPDEDRSALDMDQTQAEMEKELACSLLQRVIFNTQNDINGLLGANDREFKEELGRIVNVDIWEDAKAKTSQQLKGMESQLWTLQGQLNRLSGIKEHMGEQLVSIRQRSTQWEETKQRKLLEAEAAMKAAGAGLRRHLTAVGNGADTLRRMLEEQQLSQQPQGEQLLDGSDGSASLDQTRAFDEHVQKVEQLRNNLWALQGRLSEQRMAVGSASGQLKLKKDQLAEYLNVGQNDGDAPECDRCMQPIDQKLFAKNTARLQNDVDKAQQANDAANAAAYELNAQVEVAGQELRAAEEGLQTLKQEREFERKTQVERRQRLQRSLQAAAEQRRRAETTLIHVEWMQRELIQMLAGAGVAADEPIQPPASIDSSTASLEDAMGQLTQLAMKASDSKGYFSNAQTLYQMEEREKENPHLKEEAQLKRRLEEEARKEEEAQKQAGKLTDEVQVHKVLEKVFSPKGVLSYALEGVLQELEESTNNIMANLWPDFSLKLEYPKASDSEGSKKGRSKKGEQITKTLVRSGVEETVLTRPLSGGEERRLGLALMLGFIALMWKRRRLQCNLLVLDEALQQLDDEGCKRTVDSLKDMPDYLPGCENIFLVCQANTYVTQVFDKVDVVVKDENGASYIEEA